MKGIIKKKIAITLAFIQLFAHGLMHNNNTKDYSLYPTMTSSTPIMPKASDSTIVPVKNSKVTYKRLNKETNELSDISAFDDENISSKQYGASQRDFKYHYEDLLEDPLIWEEMQKYYPAKNYETIEDAKYIYEKYFENIYINGCGFAAAADFVFHLFEGKEEEFYKAFGYPMYTYKDDKLDFNYELFMLKFFNFYHHEMHEGEDLVMKSLLRDFYEYKALKLAGDVSYRDSFPKDRRDWTEEDEDRNDAIEKERYQKFKEYKELANNAPKGNFESGIYLDANFAYLYYYLSQHGIKVDSYYNDDAHTLCKGDIIASDEFTLYHLDEDSNVTYEKSVGLHYVYVVEVDGDNVIVSSWGSKYIFKKSPKYPIYRIRLTYKTK